jgi:hypothetical protein
MKDPDSILSRAISVLGNGITPARRASLFSSISNSVADVSTASAMARALLCEMRPPSLIASTGTGFSDHLPLSIHTSVPAGI